MRRGQRAAARPFAVRSLRYGFSVSVLHRTSWFTLSKLLAEKDLRRLAVSKKLRDVRFV